MCLNDCWKFVELFRKGTFTAKWNFPKIQVARIILHQILISPKYLLRCHRSAQVKSKFGNSQTKGFLNKKKCVFKQINFYFYLLSPCELTLCDLSLLVCIDTYQQSHNHHDGFHLKWQKPCTSVLWGSLARAKELAMWTGLNFYPWQHSVVSTALVSSHRGLGFNSSESHLMHSC